ncbi:hypothetical protein ON010_g15280 [Phytophthora cinnamomi]|nr:hypothetical protein ON010_g15280 [Phytophthora cinnamomi]
MDTPRRGYQMLTHAVLAVLPAFSSLGEMELKTTVNPVGSSMSIDEATKFAVRTLELEWLRLIHDTRSKIFEKAPQLVQCEATRSREASSSNSHVLINTDESLRWPRPLPFPPQASTSALA